MPAHYEVPNDSTLTDEQFDVIDDIMRELWRMRGAGHFHGRHSYAFALALRIARMRKAL
jgi:hypothetical protein